MLLTASACAGGGSGSAGENSQGAVDKSTPESVQSAEPDAENSSDSEEENEVKKSYMERCVELIADVMSEQAAQRRDGADYPSFKKYSYYSTTAARETSVNVLLPAEYSEDKEYPVLYILHGYYDNEGWMARSIVCVSEILSNLIADGLAREMIVVAPYIYCSKDMPHCTGMDLQNSLNYDNFINDLTTDLMPFIESEFSVAAGRENTAITGFSMGGRESLFIGFSHPELFGYIGAVCPAPGLTPVANSPMHPGQMEEADMVFSENAPYVLMISAAENDGVVGSYPYSYHSALTLNDTEHIWRTISNGAHDHTSVKPHLYDFFRVIFKEGSE